VFPLLLAVLKKGSQYTESVYASALVSLRQLVFGVSQCSSVGLRRRRQRSAVPSVGSKELQAL
jgi:hypothetical protein